MSDATKKPVKKERDWCYGGGHTFLRGVEGGRGWIGIGNAPSNEGITTCPICKREVKVTRHLASIFYLMLPRHKVPV